MRTTSRRTYRRKARRASRRYGKIRSKITRRSARSLTVRIPRSIYRRRRAPLGNFSSTKTVALRYTETININATTSAAVNVFRVNNIFDPNLTGTGHQPMYHDNYSAIYTSYRVNYATITMIALDTHAVNVATTLSEKYHLNQRACRMFILRDRDPNGYTAELNTMIEEGNRDLVWKFAPQSTSASMPTLRMGCWPHRQLDTDKKDSALAALTSGGPSRECYFICGVSDLDSGNADPDGMNFQFIITYNVTYFDLIKNQPQN